jgi:hypothetical protein
MNKKSIIAIVGIALVAACVAALVWAHSNKTGSADKAPSSDTSEDVEAGISIDNGSALNGETLEQKNLYKITGETSPCNETLENGNTTVSGNDSADAYRASKDAANESNASTAKESLNSTGKTPILAVGNKLYEVIQGAKGKTGKTGKTGAKGESIKGDTGAQGDKGDKGEKGQDGKGTPGEKGEKGNKGDVGSAGPQGDAGENGKNAYVRYSKDAAGTSMSLAPTKETKYMGTYNGTGDTGNPLSYTWTAIEYHELNYNSSTNTLTIY